MGAVDTNDLAKVEGDLYVRAAGSSGSYNRLASIRGAAANITIGNQLEIKADDTKLLAKYTKPIPTITITEWLEVADRDNLALLLGGNSSDTAGAPVAVTGEALGTGWTVGQPIKLTYKNGDDTEVASITIDADGTPLVLNTDYNVYVGDGTNGDLGYTYIVPITAQAGVLDADYTYTPNSSEGWEIEQISQELPQLDVYIEGEDPTTPTKKRRWQLDNCSMNADFAYQFVDVIENGDFGNTPLEFMGNDGSKLTYTNDII